MISEWKFIYTFYFSQEKVVDFVCVARKCLIPYCDVLKCCFHIMTCCILHLWVILVRKTTLTFPQRLWGDQRHPAPLMTLTIFISFFFRTLWSLKSGTDDTQPAEKDRVCAFFVLLSHSHALNHPKCAWASGFCVFLMCACLVCLRTIYIWYYFCVSLS